MILHTEFDQLNKLAKCHLQEFSKFRTGTGTGTGTHTLPSNWNTKMRIMAVARPTP
jgi:hypothetical protein